MSERLAQTLYEHCGCSDARMTLAKWAIEQVVLEENPDAIAPLAVGPARTAADVVAELHLYRFITARQREIDEEVSQP